MIRTAMMQQVLAGCLLGGVFGRNCSELTEAWETTGRPAVSENPPRPSWRTREEYLQIPTFLRQGKKPW